VADKDDNLLYECPLATTNTAITTACTVFASKPAGVYWDPANITPDHTKQLIYVTDSYYNTVHVFTFTGDYLGPLHDSIGALIGPSSLAIRPGPLPSLSSVSPPATATAGSQINIPLTLRDAYNNPLPDSYPIATELPLYQITATGLRDGLPTTLPGVVSSATLATITIPYSGNFTISITSSLTNPQTLHNGAFQITVDPAPTDPLVCTSTFPSAVTAGSAFTLTLSPFDSFSNPTSHPHDSFSAYFDSSPSTRFPLTRSSNSTFTFSSLMTIASSYRLHVLHNDTEVANSPFNFDVSPAPPSLLDCEQSLKGITEFDPSTGNLTLQVFAFDEFKNLVSDTDRLIVVVDGNISSKSPLLPPTYTHEFHFQPDETREIKIAVLLRKGQGTSLEHLPGSPVLIQVAPPPPPASMLVIWILFASTLIVILFANYFYSLLVSKKIEVSDERQVSVDEKLRKLLSNKIRTQNGMVLIELGDVTSDAINGVLKLFDLLNGVDDVVPWLWVLFVIVAAVAIPLGAYQITNRGRVKASYRAIINGTDEELLKALDENSAVISAESIKIRRTLIALDLSVTKLGLRGLLIEDVPSLVSNAVAIVYVMAKGTKGTMSTYATLAAFMFSCGMAGRKSGLRAQGRDLAQKKGELEELENMDEAAKGNRVSMLRQQAEIVILQEDLKRQKHNEEELAVMKAAMEELGAKQKDELGEVLIDSGEVKVERLLGKGGFGVVHLATFRGQKMAMKQLLEINNESVKRFR